MILILNLVLKLPTINKKHILICPLNWGLGHATRCIPIIKSLFKLNCSITIAADEQPLELLKETFPSANFIEFTGYGIKYPKKRNMVLSMALQAPSILKKIAWEQEETERIIKEHAIDLVISDNRYGCYSKQVPSVFITHQLFIQTSIGAALLRKKTAKYISNYTECWIPDEEGELNLSGDLSHGKKLPSNTHFIGNLSRFKKPDTTPEKKYKVCGIVSGPEPQRSIFEEKLLTQLKQLNLKAIVVKGKPSEKTFEQVGLIKIHSHLPAEQLQQAILHSEIVVSRPGYSTIMDLAALSARPGVIPTPGQTEQEYLAKYHSKNGYVCFQRQTDFDLEKLINNAENIQGFSLQPNEKKWEGRLNQLLRY